MSETVTTRFRDLAIGDTFDFIGSGARAYNSFFARCTKVSKRCYTWEGDCGAILKIRVGTINVQVFHICAKVSAQDSR